MSATSEAADAVPAAPQVSEQEARQVAEAARETEWDKPSFVRELFLGRLRIDLIHPPAAANPEEQARAAAFMQKLTAFVTTVDDEAIERTGRVPDAVIDGLREIGAFGMKIPQEYGGLGLSQRSYNRAIALIGEKLWCTNGTIAELMVVMAKTPAKEGRRPGITAFIVESDMPGVEIVSRLEFMGLRGIENAVLRFNDVRVPRENVIWGEGKGLKLALITLNTGRLTIPATTAAAARWSLGVVREWSAERVQWGQPVGKHDAVAQMIGHIAATAFALDAVSDLSAGLADAGASDIRLEAAIAKMYNSEGAWRIIDETMQVRGGRGYETAESLEGRGEDPVPVERVMRDLRINLIFEGSSEIMRLFIAREAVDPHLQKAGAFLDPKAPAGARFAGFMRLGLHVAGWFPVLVFGWGRWPRYSAFGALAKHMRFVERSSRKLGRMLLYAMVRHGAKLEKRQSVLFRLVDVGAELFAMAAACVHAESLSKKDPSDPTPRELADVFCRQAAHRVRRSFRDVFHNEDVATYRLAQETLRGRYTWLEQI
jgi:hypothetical protein